MKSWAADGEEGTEEEYIMFRALNKSEMLGTNGGDKYIPVYKTTITKYYVNGFYRGQDVSRPVFVCYEQVSDTDRRKRIDRTVIITKYYWD